MRAPRWFQRFALRVVAAWLALAGAGLAAGSCGDDPAADPPGTTGGGNDCSLGGQKCEFGCSSDYGCVDCHTDADCPAAQPKCVLAKCHECATTADCGAAKSCWPKDHTCKDACDQASDCPGGEAICDADSSACIGCSSDADCTESGKPICHPTLGQCGECSNDSHCGAAKPVCDEQTGQCEECLVDGHCDGAALCKSDHKCHFSCNTNADCTDDKKPLCNDGDCVECLTAADCPAAEPVCRDQHDCVQCVDDADCDAPAPACKGDKCVECTTNAHCAAPTPVCKGEECVECDKDEDCPDVALPKCSNQQCVAN